jgi:hypothetical protein
MGAQRCGLPQPAPQLRRPAAPVPRKGPLPSPRPPWGLSGGTLVQARHRGGPKSCRRWGAYGGAAWAEISECLYCYRLAPPSVSLTFSHTPPLGAGVRRATPSSIAQHRVSHFLPSSGTRRHLWFQRLRQTQP